MIVVVDASVAVRWVLPESGFIAAQELLAGNYGFLRVEVAAAMPVRFALKSLGQF
jgi:hypothetical protein